MLSPRPGQRSEAEPLAQRGEAPIYGIGDQRLRALGYRRAHFHGQSAGLRQNSIAYVQHQRARLLRQRRAYILNRGQWVAT